MSPLRVAGPAKSDHITPDRFYAGVLAITECSCGHPAHEHVMRVLKGVVHQIKCEANCPCRTWSDGWLKQV